jgi:hypothetical protein
VERIVVVVDVCLVDFVGHDHDTFGVAEVNDLADVLLREALARGVARIDDNDRPDIDPEKVSICQRFLQLRSLIE